jgi:hypothetical protein
MRWPVILGWKTECHETPAISWHSVFQPSITGHLMALRLPVHYHRPSHGTPSSSPVSPAISWHSGWSALRWLSIPGWKTECPEMTVDTGLEDGVPWDDRWYLSGRRGLSIIQPSIGGHIRAIRFPVQYRLSPQDARLPDRYHRSSTPCGNRRFSADTCPTCSQTIVSLLHIPLLQTLMREFASWRWQAIAICCFYVST